MHLHPIYTEALVRERLAERLVEATALTGPARVRRAGLRRPFGRRTRRADV